MNSNNIQPPDHRGTPAHGNWIVVNLPEHRIRVFDEGSLIRAIDHFSVGREHHETPLIQDGEILAYKRLRHHRSRDYPKPHGGAPMDFSLFFSDTRAFHAGDVTVESHGCVHLSPKDAEWLFHWVGTKKVHVRFVGPYSHQHSSPQLHPRWWFA